MLPCDCKPEVLPGHSPNQVDLSIIPFCSQAIQQPALSQCRRLLLGQGVAGPEGSGKAAGVRHKVLASQRGGLNPKHEGLNAQI